MSNRYYANPNRIEAGTRQLEAIAELARKMTSDFLIESNGTSTWPGVDDDFAKQVRPQEKKDREATRETCEALGKAVAGISRGTLENVKSMHALRGETLGNIAKQDSRISDANGGHGRR
ncbi:hypothetical protein [Streptomyces sp. V2I9]|uniref:hypothetical protein n=1 Tax=Streptomyces sp. V2I9 TaxID=3042304 RepID=UPI002789ECCD|nr:hypothetical protein [Streptomyces sp. V2I9]MDQ0988455.1 hypothetical protein [Streptomyces sp. V2I9]